KALAIVRLGEQIGILRIRKDRYPRIYDLVTDLVAATLLRESAPPLVRFPRPQIELHQLHQVADGLRLQYDGISARFHRYRTARQTRFLDGVLGYGREIQPLPVGMLGARPARPGAVVGPDRQRVVGGRGAVVGEHAVAVANRVGAGVDDDESGRLEIARLARGLERRQRGARTLLRSYVGGG